MKILFHLQQVRFTPPREMTPPSVHQPDFQSFQAITLKSSSDNSLAQQVQQQQQQQDPYIFQPIAQHPQQSHDQFLLAQQGQPTANGYMYAEQNQMYVDQNQMYAEQNQMYTDQNQMYAQQNQMYTDQNQMYAQQNLMAPPSPEVQRPRTPVKSSAVLVFK